MKAQYCQIRPREYPSEHEDEISSLHESLPLQKHLIWQKKH